jgi:hypothetical protein
MLGYVPVQFISRLIYLCMGLLNVLRQPFVF